MSFVEVQNWDRRTLMIDTSAFPAPTCWRSSYLTPASPSMRRLLGLAYLPISTALLAQSAQRVVDYAKADLIRTAGSFVLNSAVAPTWFQDSTRFYYRSAAPNGMSTIYVVD